MTVYILVNGEWVDAQTGEIREVPPFKEEREEQIETAKENRSTLLLRGDPFSFFSFLV